MHPNAGSKFVDVVFYYEVANKDFKVCQRDANKVKFYFSCPGYNTIDDSVYICGDFFYVLEKNDNYIYNCNKVPLIIHKDRYFVTPYTDSIAFEKSMDSIGITILSKYQYCRGYQKSDDSGPLVYVVEVPENKLKSYLSCGKWQTGLLASKGSFEKSGRNFTGISNRIALMTSQGVLPQKIQKYLESLPEVDGIFRDRYSQIEWTLLIKMGNLFDIVEITEKLMNTGYFERPVNNQMEYACPD
jgi:hypothetical protein